MMEVHDMMEVHNMVKAMVRFVNDEEGATAIEYSLIAGLISMGIIVGAALVGTTLGAFFIRVAGFFP